MTTPELITFVRGEIAKGASRDAITDMLKPQGWSDIDVNDTFNAISPTQAQTLAQAPTPTPVVTPSITPVQNTNPIVTPSVKPTPAIPLSAIHYPNAGAAIAASLAQNPGSTLNPNPNSIPGASHSVLNPLPIQSGSQTSFQPKPQTQSQPQDGAGRSHKKLKILTSFFFFTILIAGGALAYASGYLVPVEKIFSKYFQFSKPTEITRTDLKEKINKENPVNTVVPGGIIKENDTTVIDKPATIIDTTTKESATDTKIKSIESSFRASAELFYDGNNNSYKGFCSNKGSSGAYALAITLPPNTVYKCKDSTQDWISYSKITSGYFCVDSIGSAKIVDLLPTGKSCSI